MALAGHPRRPRRWRRAADRPVGRQLECRRSRAGSQRRPRSRRSMRAGSRARRRGRARGAAAPGRAGAGDAPLRPRHQLRARHPQQPAARSLRRRVDGRMTERRRRPRARPWRSTTTPRAHTTDNARRARRRACSAGTPPGPLAALADDSRRRAARAGSAPLAAVPEGRSSACTSAAGGRSSSGTRTVRGRRRAARRCTRRHDRAHRGRPGRALVDRPCGRAARLPRDRRVRRRELLDARGASSSGSTCSSRATPGRCTSPPRSARRSSPSSGRRIRRATRLRGRRDRVVRIDLPAAPAIASASRRSAASGTRPTASAGIAADASSTRRLRRSTSTGACGRPAPVAHDDAAIAVEREAGGARRRVDLARYLDARPGGTRDRGRESPWIKSLRHAGVDGGRCAAASRSAAIRSGGSRSSTSTSSRRSRRSSGRSPRSRRSDRARAASRCSSRPRRGPVVRWLAPQVAAARHVRYPGARRFGRRPGTGGARGDGRARQPGSTAPRSRHASARRAAARRDRAAVLAFVHRAFWRADARRRQRRGRTSGRCSRRSTRRPGDGALAYVGVGPAANFRARRWWHPVWRSRRRGAAHPIEAFAPLAALRRRAPCGAQRHRLRRALWSSDDLRAAASIRGCDCWPLVREELAGVALLQWPWSARAMDEAAAALDALAPARRAHLRGSRRLGPRNRAREPPPRHSVGRPAARLHLPALAQLPARAGRNAADPRAPVDAGFPSPTLTLLFDGYAARHLTEPGALPARRAARHRQPAARRAGERRAATARRSSGARAQRRGRPARAGAGGHEVPVRRSVLGMLLDAAAHVPGVHVAIKTHPAETPEVYADAARRPSPRHRPARVAPRWRRSSARAGPSSPSTRPSRSTRQSSASRRS